MVNRERADLLEKLSESEDFLRASAQAFDAGFEAEAKRLAVTLRVLLHDTDKSKSLLALLGVKDRMLFTDTSDGIDPANLMPTPGLVAMEWTAGPDPDPKYVALLERANNFKLIHFEEWWTTDVTKTPSGEFWSRKYYITTLANKEGGAHVDPKLNARFEALAKNNAYGWVAGPPGAELPFQRSPVAAAVRQVSYEVGLCLDRHRDLLR